MTKINTIGFRLDDKQEDRINVETSRIVKMIPEGVDISVKIENNNKFNDIFTATISINLYSNFIKGVCGGTKPELAVDGAVDDIIRKIRKVKTNKIDKKRGIEVPMKDIEVHTVEDEEITMDDFYKIGETSSLITKTKNIDMRPMTIDEAISEMELHGHDFFVFYNLDGESRVVYKRSKKKGYGLLCGKAF